MSVSIVGYTYEADMHCVGCTRKRAERDGFKIDAKTPEGDNLDENDIHYGSTDTEGNLIHPIFSTDELQLDESNELMTAVCRTCGGVIREP